MLTGSLLFALISQLYQQEWVFVFIRVLGSFKGYKSDEKYSIKAIMSFIHDIDRVI